MLSDHLLNRIKPGSHCRTELPDDERIATQQEHHSATKAGNKILPLAFTKQFFSLCRENPIVNDPIKDKRQGNFSGCFAFNM